MLFCILDGTLVFLAVATFNFIHPLWFLPPLPPLSDGHLDDPRQDDDASFFDNTPIGHGTKYASADSGRTLSNWGFPKPAYMTQNDARASESGTVDTDGPLEWVPTNERSSQMRPLYEGNVYHGRNASQ